MSAIFRRDFKSYFTSPIGFVYIAVFMFFAGLYFTTETLLVNTSDMSRFFDTLLTIFMYLIPLLTMRSISEERKTKTDTVLLTAPVNLVGVVLGKFLAAFAVFMLGLGLTLIYYVVVVTFGTPESTVIMGHYIGLSLVGAALISIGLFVSSLTENQIVAAVGSFAVILILWVISKLVVYIEQPILSKILRWLSVYDRYAYFVYGILDLTTVIYYISISFVFLFLTVRVFEKRRWS